MTSAASSSGRDPGSGTKMLIVTVSLTLPFESEAVTSAR